LFSVGEMIFVPLFEALRKIIDEKLEAIQARNGRPIAMGAVALSIESRREVEE
jgi:hypothetical protein